MMYQLSYIGYKIAYIVYKISEILIQIYPILYSFEVLKKRITLVVH